MVPDLAQTDLVPRSHSTELVLPSSLRNKMAFLWTAVLCWRDQPCQLLSVTFILTFPFGGGEALLAGGSSSRAPGLQGSGALADGGSGLCSSAQLGGWGLAAQLPID